KLIAQHVVDAQCRHLRAAISQVLDELAAVMETADQRCLDIEKPSAIISGSGASVVEHLLQHAHAFRFTDQLRLSDMFRHPISESACAFAVARLAHDRCRDDLLEPTAL
ncbi:MAG: hypothetical protein ABGZ53_12040, partial [Fuerstiella sp.]